MYGANESTVSYQRDLKDKMEAAATHDRGIVGRSLSGAAVCEPRSGPLMEQTVEDCHAAVGELAAQVEELLARISPVCQPKGVLAQGKEGGGAIEASPSPLRGEFMKLRARVQDTSARISSVRHTIEI